MKSALSILILVTIILGLLVSGISCNTSTTPSPTPTPISTPDYTSAYIKGQDWVKMTYFQKSAWIEIALDRMVSEGVLYHWEIKATSYYIQKLDDVFSDKESLSGLVAWELTAFTSTSYADWWLDKGFTVDNPKTLPYNGKGNLRANSTFEIPFYFDSADYVVVTLTANVMGTYNLDYIDTYPAQEFLTIGSLMNGGSSPRLSFLSKESICFSVVKVTEQGTGMGVSGEEKSSGGSNVDSHIDAYLYLHEPGIYSLCVTNKMDSAHDIKVSITQHNYDW